MGKYVFQRKNVAVSCIQVMVNTNTNWGNGKCVLCAKKKRTKMKKNKKKKWKSDASDNARLTVERNGRRLVHALSNVFPVGKLGITLFAASAVQLQENSAHENQMHGWLKVNFSPLYYAHTLTHTYIHSHTYTCTYKEPNR